MPSYSTAFSKLSISNELCSLLSHYSTSYLTSSFRTVARVEVPNLPLNIATAAMSPEEAKMLIAVIMAQVERNSSVPTNGSAAVTSDYTQSVRQVEVAER